MYTDNYSLSHLVQKGTSNRRFARWTLDLAEYSFHVKHKDGRQNTAADTLSKQLEDAEPKKRSILTRDLFCYAVIISKHTRLRKFQEKDTEWQKIPERRSQRELQLRNQ